MSTTENQNIVQESPRRKWLKYFWGALPLLALIVIIMILSALVNAKSGKLEAANKGLKVLEGMRLASKDTDRIMAVISASKDPGDAVKKLADELKMTPEQAKAVLHMPLAAFSELERAKLDKQIAYIQKQIQEKKIDVEPERPDLNVAALELSPVTIMDRINLPGIVEPWVKYNIIAEVRGEVRQKLIGKGTPIQAGDVIAVLDTRDYAIAIEAAKASYDTSLSSMKRIEKLYSEKLASRSQLDEISAQMERFKAELDSARLNFERCTIRSPITGIINNVYIEKGEYVNLSDPIAEVLQMDKIKISVGIPESDVSAVSSVEDFEVRLDALDGKTFNAKKYFLSKSSDAEARLYKLELEIENPAHEILPDMFARVDIIKREISGVLAVPLYSVITLNNQQTVYVVNENIARARKVKTGIQEGWLIQITEGLEPGDNVIVVGHRRVSEGQKVNVVRTVRNMEELAN
ncbi:MAG: efflux RND transporter periplasmic adaptor subunit [Desulfobacterales bacterium]|jgi:RND family efflux transporter MFP subunit|nr:efflux RND transporter periplasmic adaptor subunit [Desulfobacterales bacterium]